MNEVKICVLKNTCPVKILVLKSAVNKIAIGSLFNAKMVFYYSIYFLKVILFWKDCPFHPGCQGGCPCQNYKIIFELKFKIFNKIKYIRNISLFPFSLFFRKVPRSNFSDQLSVWSKSFNFRMGWKRKLYWKYRLYLWSWDIGKLKNKIKN